MNSSYEAEEIFVLKAVGPSRILLFFMLPVTLFVDFLVFSFYFLTNLFSPNLKKIIHWFFFEIKSSLKKGLTGKFEIDQNNITPNQYEKLVSGKIIVHPLYGKCRLIESQVQNFVTGKNDRVKKAS
jgi:hypothetical protein